MPRNANGEYTLLVNSFASPVLGEVIDPNDASALWGDFVDAFNTIPPVGTTTLYPGTVFTVSGGEYHSFSGTLIEAAYPAFQDGGETGVTCFAGIQIAVDVNNPNTSGAALSVQSNQNGSLLTSGGAINAGTVNNSGVATWDGYTIFAVLNNPITAAFPQGTAVWATLRGGRANGTNTIDASRHTNEMSWDATVTFDSTTDAVLWTGHTLQANDALAFTNSGGALPNPLVSDTEYFVKTVLTANSFTLSATQGGALIDLTTNGTGTTTSHVYQNPANGAIIFNSTKYNAFQTGLRVASARDYGVRVGSGDGNPINIVPTHPYSYMNNSGSELFYVASAGNSFFTNQIAIKQTGDTTGNGLKIMLSSDSAQYWELYEANSQALKITKNSALGMSLDPSGDLVVDGTLQVGTAGGSSGSLALVGSTSGTVTIQPQAAAGTFNFNLPTTAGSAGAALLSGAGGASAMTWTAGALAIASGKTATFNSTTTFAGTDGKTVTHNASTTFAGTDAKTLTISNSGTLAGGDAFTLAIAASKTLTVNNTLTLSGTDATTMTFPTTSATIARTDAGNTFTGHQTIEGVTSTGATGTGNFVFSSAPALTGEVTVTAPASGTSNTFTIKAGGNTAADVPTWRITSLAGTVVFNMFGDALNGNFRIKALGAVAFHAGNVAVSSTNEFLTIDSTGWTGFQNNQSLTSGGSTTLSLRISSSQIGIYAGSGAPTISAAKGSLYLRSDGTTTNDRAYINTNGSTTWTALTTAA